MRDWREGKTKHLVEYGEGRAIVTFPFGIVDRTTVEKKCSCKFVPTNLFGLLGFVLNFRGLPLLCTVWQRKSITLNPGLRELHRVRLVHAVVYRYP